MPELVGLVGVLKYKSVEVARASDLELGLVGRLVLLYPRRCCRRMLASMPMYSTALLMSTLSCSESGVR